MYTDRLAALRAAEHGLAFGRLDTETGERRYIGRLGPARRGERVRAAPDGLARARGAARSTPPPRPRPRACAAAGTCAPAAARSLAVDDEVLDLDDATAAAGSSTGPDERGGAAGRGRPPGAPAGWATSSRRSRPSRTAIIRSTPSGVLVVQGGPGTGKTAVALHRAAYLLYTHRDRLARRGVLVVGPNATFLRYIGQVLPSLGETSVVLGTVGQLFPGLDARRPRRREVAEVKGRAGDGGRDRRGGPRPPAGAAAPGRAGRRAAAGAAGPGRRQRRAHRVPGGRAARTTRRKRIFHREAVRLLAEQVARSARRAGVARPARRRRPVRHPRRAERRAGS